MSDKTTFTNIRVILNPIAGGGKAPRYAEKAAGLLRKNGARVDVFPTTGPGDAVRLTRESRSDDLIAVLGGDGTIGETINGLEREVPLALFPMGTSNVLSRSLCLPRKPETFASMISAGKTRRIDLGATTKKKFVLLAGIGLDAEIVKDFTGRRKTTASKLNYVRPLLSCYLKHRFKTIAVRIDGREVYTGPASIVVTNVPYYAGPFTTAPGARVDDGLLDVVIFGARTKIGIAKMGIGMLLGGRHTRMKGVIHVKGKEIRIEADEPAEVQLDGDPAGLTPLSIKVLPGALAILTP